MEESNRSVCAHNGIRSTLYITILVHLSPQTLPTSHHPSTQSLEYPYRQQGSRKARQSKFSRCWDYTVGKSIPHRRGQHKSTSKQEQLGAEKQKRWTKYSMVCGRSSICSTRRSRWWSRPREKGSKLLTFYEVIVGQFLEISLGENPPRQKSWTASVCYEMWCIA